MVKNLQKGVNVNCERPLKPFLVSVPIEIEAHTGPHFKAPVTCKVEGWGQEHAGTFTYYNSIVKLGGLVNKMGFDKTEVPMTIV